MDSDVVTQQPEGVNTTELYLVVTMVNFKIFILYENKERIFLKFIVFKRTQHNAEAV